MSEDGVTEVMGKDVQAEESAGRQEAPGRSGWEAGGGWGTLSKGPYSAGRP